MSYESTCENCWRRDAPKNKCVECQKHICKLCRNTDKMEWFFIIVVNVLKKYAKNAMFLYKNTKGVISVILKLVITFLKKIVLIKNVLKKIVAYNNKFIFFIQLFI